MEKIVFLFVVGIIIAFGCSHDEYSYVCKNKSGTIIVTFNGGNVGGNYEVYLARFQGGGPVIINKQKKDVDSNLVVFNNQLPGEYTITIDSVYCDVQFQIQTLDCDKDNNYAVFDVSCPSLDIEQIKKMVFNLWDKLYEIWCGIPILNEMGYCPLREVKARNDAWIAGSKMEVEVVESPRIIYACVGSTLEGVCSNYQAMKMVTDVNGFIRIVSLLTPTKTIPSQIHFGGVIMPLAN